MTRPDIERIRAVFDRPGDEVHVEMIADLCRYALALETARDEILDPADGRNSQPFWQSVRDEFNAAVARWEPHLSGDIDHDPGVFNRSPEW